MIADIKPWAWIVICEPSIFPHATEPHTLRGPIVGFRKAKSFADKYLNRFPFGKCSVIPADSEVTMNNVLIEPEPLIYRG